MLELKIKTLRKGWHDRDEVLLHAAFQILVEYIRKEKPHKIIDWNYNSESRRTWKSINALYHWWTQERPRRRSPLDSSRLKRPARVFKTDPNKNVGSLIPYDKKKYKAYDQAIKLDMRLEEKWIKEDQQRLHQLVEIRQYLWT